MNDELHKISPVEAERLRAKITALTAERDDLKADLEYHEDNINLARFDDQGLFDLVHQFIDDEHTKSPMRQGLREFFGLPLAKDGG